ncbi:hypothetical protein JHW43_008548 [Diplocarpon mali]|nr:hypothetical protein JHW43_008548 [Diplocarpon mali]
MAVLKSLLAIEVTVCVNSKALTKHQAENDRAQHIDGKFAAHQQGCSSTKFIESITDEDFTANILTGQKPSLSRVGLSSLRSSPRSLRVRLWSFSPPVGHFAKFKIILRDSRSSNLQRENDKAKKLREIVVKIHRQSEGRQVEPGKPNFEKLASPRESHQKARIEKSKSHGVALGAVKSIDPGRTRESEFLDGMDYPIAILRFKYRSAQALEDLLRIPRIPPPEPAAEPKPEAAEPESPESEFDDLAPEPRERAKRALERAERGRSEDDDNVKQDAPPSKKTEARKMIGKLTTPLTEGDGEDKGRPAILLDQMIRTQPPDLPVAITASCNIRLAPPIQHRFCSEYTHQPHNARNARRRAASRYRNDRSSMHHQPSPTAGGRIHGYAWLFLRGRQLELVSLAPLAEGSNTR